MSKIASILPLFATLAFLGCKQEKPAPTTQRTDPRKQAHWEEKPLPVNADPVPIAQGPTPLIHLFDLAAPIRVVDLTTGQRLLTTIIPGRTLVRIDDRNGVTVGNQKLVPGPLPPGHRYAIYADPQTPNVLRQGIGPPGDSPR